MNGVVFPTREMADGSGTTGTFVITVDGALSSIQNTMTVPGHRSSR
ncbi:hypothetical protein BH18ACT5_BH18ACT5_19610 [soil metagenome]